MTPDKVLTTEEIDNRARAEELANSGLFPLHLDAKAIIDITG